MIVLLISAWGLKNSEIKKEFLEKSESNALLSNDDVMTENNDTEKCEELYVTNSPAQEKSKLVVENLKNQFKGALLVRDSEWFCDKNTENTITELKKKMNTEEKLLNFLKKKCY